MGEDFAERDICEWPGCSTETKDQVAMSTHLRQIHDRVKWVCPVRICRRRFVTEDQVIRHVQEEHAGQSDDAPAILLEQYRTFDTDNLRFLRERAMKTADSDSEEEMQADVERFYAAYHSRTARVFFDNLGLLHQEATTLCRTLQEEFEKCPEGATHLNEAYPLVTHGRSLNRNYHWWVLFLSQEEGPQLDKFVRNAVLGGYWCHISHRCHWGWCLNVAHLEQVLRVVNDDRSICKNGSRGQYGGCNALSSLHPHDHCLLRNPIGAPNVQTRRSGRPTKNFGPCAEGHTTTWGGKWYRDPDDKTRQLCGNRYQRAS